MCTADLHLMTPSKRKAEQKAKHFSEIEVKRILTRVCVSRMEFTQQPQCQAKFERVNETINAFSPTMIYVLETKLC